MPRISWSNGPGFAGLNPAEGELRFQEVTAGNGLDGIGLGAERRFQQEQPGEGRSRGSSGLSAPACRSPAPRRSLPPISALASSPRLGDRALHCALAWRRLVGDSPHRRPCACRSPVLSKVFIYLRCKSLAARARTSARLSVASASASFSLSVIPRARRQRLTRSPSLVRRLRTTSARPRFCLR